MQWLEAMQSWVVTGQENEQEEQKVLKNTSFYYSTVVVVNGHPFMSYSNIQWNQLTGPGNISPEY